VRNPSRLALLLWIVAAAQPVGASAEAQPQDTFTLEQAVTVALAQNPSVRIARQAVAAAEGLALQARAIPDPEISVEVNGIPRGLKLGDAEEQRIGITQPFEYPGKRALRTRLGRDALAQARLALERTQRWVRAEVRKGFYRVLAAEERLETLRALQETLKQVQETVIARYRSGSVPYTEINRTRMELGRIQNEILEAKQRLAALRRAFNVLLGRVPDRPLRLRGSLEDFEVPRGSSIEGILAQSLTVRILELEMAAAEKRLGLARMSYYPDFQVGVFADRLDGPEPLRGWALEAGMRIPLWWTWKQRGSVREAEGRLGESRQRYQAALQALRAKAADALSRARTARSRMENYRNRLLPEAEDALHAGLTHYQYGRIDTLNLLDLYRSYRAVKLEAIQAVLAYQEALARLSVAGERFE